MTQKREVFVLTNEPYHDNSTVIGVFSTAKAARAHLPRRKWVMVTRCADDGPTVIGWAREPGGCGGWQVTQFVVDQPEPA